MITLTVWTPADTSPDTLLYSVELVALTGENALTATVGETVLMILASRH
jgi:hypothetical protein